MSALGQTSSAKGAPFQNVLINNDLVVHYFPIDVVECIGKYLVYKVADDEAMFWNLLDTKIEAVNCASNICGYAVQIQTLERP